MKGGEKQMEEKSLSGSDALSIQAMTDRNNGSFMSGDGLGLFFIFALLLMNNGNWGNNGRPFGVSEGELAASQAAQTTQLQMSNLLTGQQNNLFEIANMFSSQNLSMMQQNNTNLINAIQGFNNVQAQIANQTNVLATQIQQLDAKLSQCCCEIKTQMLQDRLDEAERRNVVLQNSLDNANQSQYILGQLGRFVAWAGSGSQAAVTAG
jgi:hypothetical protein